MSSRSPEGDFTNKRRRISSSPSAHSQHAARVQNGLKNAVFPPEIFSYIFKYFNSTPSPSPSPFFPYPFEISRRDIAPLTLLCKGLQSEGVRTLYHSISIGSESESSQRCRILLRSLQDRPELRSYVKALEFQAKDVDTRATIYMEITRLCKNLELLHLCGTNAYDMSQMRGDLAQIDPVFFSLRAGNLMPSSVNNIQTVFAFISGWKNIRQLDIGSGLLHLPAPSARPDHTWKKARFPIQYLGSQDADWTAHSLQYLQREIDLPDLIQFQGGVLINLETLPALAGCLQLWSSTLTTLILQLPKGFTERDWCEAPDCRELSECISSLPHLRMLAASTKHIDPVRVLSCPSLEDLYYSDTNTLDLWTLGRGLRDPTRDGGRWLPALRRLATWWIKDLEFARDAQNLLCEELLARNVDYWWC